MIALRPRTPSSVPLMSFFMLFFRLSRRVLALVLAIIGATAAAISFAAPTLDTTFGNQGKARIGAVAGTDDRVLAAQIQADGKMVIAGLLTGRQSQYFVARFTPAGTLDPAFGSSGMVSLTADVNFPLQIEFRSDGSFFVLHRYSSTTPYRVVRHKADGNPDFTFGLSGRIDLANPAKSSIAPRIGAQPDGKLLVMYGGGAGALWLDRFLANGGIDSQFGSSGSLRISIGGSLAYDQPDLVVPEPAGGFTFIATSGSDFVIGRVDGNGALDRPVASGLALGTPSSTPGTLSRRPDGSYVVLARANSGSTNVIWAVDREWKRLPFGATGPVTTNAIQIDALPDGDVVAQTLASADSIGADPLIVGTSLSLTRYDSNGALRTGFGTGGTAIVTTTGYGGIVPAGIRGDATGRILIAASLARTLAESALHLFPRAQDAVVIALTPSGAPQAGFGSSNGIAMIESTEESRDRIDTVRIDTSGRINLVGYTAATFANYLAIRLRADGSLDSTYGTDGRTAPAAGRFIGMARAVLQGDGSLVVASGDAAGSFGTVASVVSFRIRPDGSRDPSYSPFMAAVGGNGTPGLAIRSDGRVVYGASSSSIPSSVTLQQFLVDGTGDPGFGTGGTVSFGGETVDRFHDVVVARNGDVVMANFLPASDPVQDRLQLIRVDSAGKPVATFGTAGIVTMRTEKLPRGNFFTSLGSVTPIPTLIEFDDGTLGVAYDLGTDSVPTFALWRFTSDGRFINGIQLGGASYSTSRIVALPDSSLVIARNHPNSTVTLIRLLPDNQMDAAFGAFQGTSVTGLTSVTALALDAERRLVLAGFDATGAVALRYRLDNPVAGVLAVEFYNVDLKHYFMTANQAEMTAIDTGGAGPGWQRTGQAFKLWVPEAGVAIGARPVCRFYGTPGRGPNSHFYTAGADECAAVKFDAGWTYEGIAFYVKVAQTGLCDSTAVPVYRAYNNRFAQNDSNHRYATQRPLLEAMQPLGWSVEGTAFCGAP